MTPPKPPQNTSVSATDIYVENAIYSHGKDFQFGAIDPKQNDADDHAWKALAFAS